MNSTASPVIERLEHVIDQLTLIYDTHVSGAPWSYSIDESRAEREFAEWNELAIDRLDSAFVSQANGHINKVFDRGRRGEDPELCLQFLNATIGEVIQTPLFPKSKLLVKSTGYAATAYMHFKLGNIPEANDILDLALEADELLETEHNWQGRHIHRIHMVENRMIVLLSDKNDLAGFELGYNLLQYISGNASTLSERGRWSTEMLQKVKPHLREIKFIRIGMRLCSALRSSKQNTKGKFAARFADLAGSDVPFISKNDFLRSWLVLKATTIQGDDLEFLSKLLPILQKHKQYQELLFADLLVDICDICERSGYIEEFAKVMVPFLAAWRRCPQNVRRRLQLTCEGVEN